MEALKHIYKALKVTAKPDWNKALELNSFTYPWLPDNPPETRFRALWDKDNFYFRFDVVDSKILTFQQTNHKMEVVDSDRVEIFFRKDDQLAPYYCLEMYPHGRVLDYKAHYYRQFDFEWAWPGREHLDVQSALTASGYYVEGSISLESLKQLGLLRNNELQAGLFRGQCVQLPDPESEFKWISWVQPDSDHPDFHIPSAFGKVILEDMEGLS
jgi:hypothetical protein